MDDLISRKAAIKALKRHAGVDGFCDMPIEYITDAIRAVPSAVPSAQPEPAQWVQMLINPRMYKCSNCQVAWNKRLVFDNEGHSENIFMKYCPCCGRKMKAKIDYE